jgi:hypothetical protein
MALKRFPSFSRLEEILNKMTSKTQRATTKVAAYFRIQLATKQADDFFRRHVAQWIWVEWIVLAIFRKFSPLSKVRSFRPVPLGGWGGKSLKWLLIGLSSLLDQGFDSSLSELNLLMRFPPVP